MFKFIFKSGNRTVDPKIVRRSPMFTRLSSDFVKAIGSTSCPNHKTECSATVLIDALTGRDWQIIGSCCSDYKQLLELSVTLQWDAETEKMPT